MNHRTLPLMAALVLAWAGTVPLQAHAASAAASAAGASAPHAKLSHADSAFLKDAAQAGHAEVEGSKLALSKSANAQVKTFAQQMVDDHTKVGDELTALATAKGVDVPKEPSMAQKAKLKLLSARDGTGFDKHYAESIGVAAHKDTVKLFKKAVQEVKDPDVKAFAEKTLPALEHHLEMAQDLKTAMDQIKK